MTSREIIVKTSTNVIAGYNNAGSSGSIGVKVSNLVDTNLLSTGISIHVTNAFSGSGGNGSTWATAAYHGLDESYWEWAWNSTTNGVGIIELRGFPANKSVTLKLTGHSLTGTRHTDFIVNGVTAPRFTNKSALPPLMALSPVSHITRR